MKRHPDLREFADDHYQGMVNALRLNRTAAGERLERGANPAHGVQASRTGRK
ncbi:MAG: hypothetical protein ACFB50_11180 [Rubrobacteraceae bacterium]